MLQPFVLSGGTVVDGSGSDPIRADVRVGPDGRISDLSPSLQPAEGDLVLDVGGRSVAPGFVDMHSHSDLYTLVREEAGAPLGDAPKLVQGCTAQVFGQDGISAAPVADDDVEGYAAYIAGLDGFLAPAKWTWRSFGEYLAALRRSSTTRVAGLVGHSTVRRFAMGMEARPPRSDEMEAMCSLVDRAMSEGALGLSTGLVYAPAAYAGFDELLALCEVVARHDGKFFVHVRSESDRVVEASEEVLEVCRRSGASLHYSHIKTAGRANWGKAGTMLELIDHYRSLGVRVTADVHPYTAGSTTATVLVPPWVLEGGTADAIRRLGDKGVREKARQQILGDTTSWDNWWAFSDGWGGLRVAGARRPGAVGRSFEDLIRAAGVDDPCTLEGFDVAFDFLVEEELGASLISFNNVEENVARFMAQPFCTIGSDALVNPDGHPHPRLFGTFPRVLGHYVRELSALDLPSAVQAMTVRGAEVAGFTGLGALRPGRVADLVVFDPAAVTDMATYEEPRLTPKGIDGVWIAGRRVVDGQALSGQVPPAAA
ncbi:MAG: N-acyl-D-amino-acid deacylase family protein [Acidimicrobiales bacterium]